MAEESGFKCNVQDIEMTHSIDTSSIMSSLGDYSKGKKLFQSFHFADLIGKIRFHLKPGENEDYCSFFLELNPTKNKKDKDNRKVLVTVKCGSSYTRSFCKSVSEFMRGPSWGWSKLVSIEYLSKYPKIQFTLKMHNDPQLVIPQHLRNNSLYEQRNNSLYELSKIDGDIILTISVICDEDDSMIKTPPRKRRKLNDNNNDTNDVSDDIEGLKRDDMTEMKVSSIILKSSSPVFKNILSNDMVESKEKTINVVAKSVDDVDNMIYFMCTNKLRENTNPINLIELAHFYQMEDLKFKCINKMIKSISVHNFVEILNTFDRYSISDGYQTIIQFAKNNMEELKQNDQISHSFKMSVFGMAKY